MTPPICRVVLNAPGAGAGGAAVETRGGQVGQRREERAGADAEQRHRQDQVPDGCVGLDREREPRDGDREDGEPAGDDPLARRPCPTAGPRTARRRRTASEPGRPTSAAFSGLRPRTSCRNSVNGKKMPIIAKVTAPPATLDSEKLRLWNRVSGSSASLAAVALPEHEADEHEHPGADDAPHRDRSGDGAPVVGRALLEAEHDEEHADDGQQDAEPVERPVRRGERGEASAARARGRRRRRGC